MLLNKNIAFALLILSLIFMGGLAVAQENAECLECHDEAYGEVEPALPYDSLLALTSHEGMDCVACHISIKELPHAEDLPDVVCFGCHEGELETYQWHGRFRLDECEDLPCCSDCHGHHYILPPSHNKSWVNPQNLPETCGRCHEDLDLVKKHEILFEKAVEVYKSSVHGQATLGGVHLAATCNDCHSAGGTAHRILGPGHPESPINHFNIPNTCGKCHRAIMQDYWEGIHGKLAARGEVDSPVCTDCHGEHGIISPSDPRSPVSPTRLAEATCAPCHESARLNEKYGVPTGRLRTYVDSYHGLKSKAGDLTVANCASCHGAHRILPHTDSTSSIHPSNLQETCGDCHPGITKALANTPIHGTPGISSTPLAGIIQDIYIVIIFVIIGSMVIHWLIDLRKKIKRVSQKQQVRRMTPGEVGQHTVLMISFIVLVITGFSLRFSDAFWVKLLFGWEGGFPLRGILHRVAAVILVLGSIWHVLFLFTARGKQFIKDIFPNKRDFEQLWQMLRYNIGNKSQPPRFGRFSYIEKAEYWALVWGTAVMAITGFFLWFDNLAVQWFPKGFLDVMLVIHYYEAWLATLAILIWHMYSTIFNPDVYPMNPSWYTGKMPLDVYKHEHPEDPVLKENDGKE
ncbi:MAG: hypothetical protein GF307_03940 [candidate division Zixibacteria bacterium]|nr:hypothetical protein [candidate division Zixibacteria bacterium]